MGKRETNIFMVTKKPKVTQINVIKYLTVTDFNSEEVMHEIEKVNQEINEVLKGMAVDFNKL